MSAVDVMPQYRGVIGGWTTVNGYSGYEPAYYQALRAAVDTRDPALFTPFRARGDLHVLVDAGTLDVQAFVEQQPGVRLVARHASLAQYWLPQQDPSPAEPSADVAVPIHALDASCNPWLLAAMLDDNPRTGWFCDHSGTDAEVTVDLGRTTTIRAVVYGLGSFRTDVPRRLVMATSVDGLEWEHAWDGPIFREIIEASFDDPEAVRAVLPFQPRAARYVRMSRRWRDSPSQWSIARLEVRSRTRDDP